MFHPEAPDGRPPDAERVTYTKADFARLRRGLRENWGVPDAIKTDAMWQAWLILNREQETSRNKLAAMRFLASLDLAERREDRQSHAETASDEPSRANAANVEAALKLINGESDERDK